MSESYSIYYSTKTLFVLFDCLNDRITCRIYSKRGENWRVLQSYSMKRPGLSKLDDKTAFSCKRQMLKAMRNRMTKALEVHLKHSKVLA